SRCCDPVRPAERQPRRRPCAGGRLDPRDRGRALGPLLLEEAGGALLRPPTPRRRRSRAAQIGEPWELRRRRSVGEERCPGAGELASPWCQELGTRAVAVAPDRPQFGT